jgi:hypothetical protein
MDEQPTGRTNPRGAWIFVIVVLVIALVVVGVFLSAGSSDPACDAWDEAKSEWVSSFPPIQQQTKSDLADYQGWVEVGGQRTDRPEGCP